MENNTNQLNSMLCKRNCGFFGNPSCDGYCSKCYKDHVKRQNSGSAAGRVTPTTGLSTTTSTTTSTNQSQAINAGINAISETMMAPVTNALLDEIKIAQEKQQHQEATSSTTTNTITTTTTTSFNLTSNELNDSAMSSFTLPSTPASTSTHQQQQATIPIPIPSARGAAEAMHSNDATGMSVPADFLGTSLVSTASSPGTSVEGSSATASGGEKKKRTRCCVGTCRRKVGLTGFDCRCGGLYCWEHRYSDKHDCQFDYKELGQDQIRKNNPIVVGEKIQKI